ncbi:aminotransferase class I/II-fold pyridoxal phosphate-dependent enzyme [Bhargavaea beijingensis]|uniref:Aminotransferase n=1 Tax=Bhargavaea beijingensis TaxID=426756 RepID=A0A1G7BV87_9BACL|nr:aminotransferase class I/II-fold pyridoxal phosphate-dependent enzyme [Bhargavaea beijingensis]MCW1926673.1 aminotransferase class I/II-fold pyridoxal phosphate-dependent enzyme [Bhargavaea beijingensis]RSK37071.1 aminotransferase class I/II-fold pyridoxal phosphate-dependent enzyme [Bhargavaea beijingensis]SDE31041.1 aminotransferase [Bhargavaea beijingensis]
MALKINPLVEKTPLSGIRQMSNRLPAHPGAVNLTVGQPDFPPPDEVKQAARQAIGKRSTGYSMNAGLPELREAAAVYYGKKYGFRYDPVTETVITGGGSGSMDAVLRTILEPGDEAIIPVPIYAGYEPLIRLAGAAPVYLDTRQTGFVPDADTLEKMITPQTKVVIFNNPSNPTGVAIPEDRMDQLASVLARHELFILSDDIYSENTFDAPHRSFGSYPALRDRLFLIHGLSKSHSMTGWRIGVLFGPSEVMQHIVKIHAYNAICAPTPSQYAAIEAYTGSTEAPEQMNRTYIKRRAFITAALKEMQLPHVRPTGAFYAFPSIEEFPITSKDFAIRALEEEGVAVVHGSAFTLCGEGHIRISYAAGMEQLEKGMERLGTFVRKLRGNTQTSATKPVCK